MSLGENKQINFKYLIPENCRTIESSPSISVRGRRILYMLSFLPDLL